MRKGGSKKGVCPPQSSPQIDATAYMDTAGEALNMRHSPPFPHECGAATLAIPARAFVSEGKTT